VSVNTERFQETPSPYGTSIKVKAILVSQLQWLVLAYHSAAERKLWPAETACENHICKNTNPNFNVNT
jgi:hypothetical protein